MEILLRLLGALEMLLCWLTAPIYYVLTWFDPKPLPPIANGIILHTALELAKKIRMEELTCEQVVRAFILRCREVNPLINAVVEERYAAALREAHSLDQLMHTKQVTAEQLEKDKPLFGVPFTVKESVGVQGMSQSVGCLLRRDVRATTDGGSVANLRRAGAIPIAITNTPELCLSWETNNLMTGRTLNPYNAHHTCGGSSGGEAAMIAAGGSVVGVASDIAGSIRIPAAFCGVFGHKPTPGYVSLSGHFPSSEHGNFDHIMSVGPMVRYVEDLTPMFKIMAGEKASQLKLDEEVNLKKLRIFYTTELVKSRFMIPTDDEIHKTVKTAANHFKHKHNCHIDELYIEEFDEIFEICNSLFFEMEGIPDLMSYSNSDDPKVKKNLFFEFIKGLFGLSDFSLPGLLFAILYQFKGFVPSSRRQIYKEMHTTLKKKLTDILGSDGVFILPTHPIPAYLHGQFTMKTAGVAYTMLFNTLAMPATNVPAGINKHSLPIGIQVVAAPHQDRLCLAVAKELGQILGGWFPPS